VVEVVDDVLLNTRPFARLGRADAVSPRETAKLILAFGVCPLGMRILHNRDPIKYNNNIMAKPNYP
jgi:hypothetical protein